MMKLLKHFTVVVVVCFLYLENAATQNVTGRCCLAKKGDDSGSSCPGTTSGNFSPPVEGVGNDVFWEAQDLDCPLTHSVVYYDINYDGYNQLDIIKDELMFEYHPNNLFSKWTREFCVEAHDDHFRGAVCQPDPEKMCDNAICIPKCCGEGEVLQDYSCRKGAGNMSLQFYSFHGKPISVPTDMVMIGDMMPDCGDGFPSTQEDISEIHLLGNGKLMERKTQVIHKFNHYCIEDHYSNGGHSLLYLMCSEPENTAIVVKHHLQRIGYVVSVVLLVATILFHIFIPSLMDIQGLCLISHMVSMAVADIFLFVLSQASFSIGGACIFSGFILLYSFLAMFFWLNIMCFDIWRVIRDTAKGIPLRGILSNDAKKFRLYCLYGFGCPLVVVVVAAIMHTLPEEHAKNITPPGIGKETCWLSGDRELLLYCYAYVGALFILDLVFLGHTMFLLFQAGCAFMCFSKQVVVTAFNRKHLEAFWQRFSLFILMVLCWTTEILSWKIPPRELWIVTDAINSFQGLLVFIIFISSKKRRDMVINLLKKVPLPCLRSLKKETPHSSCAMNSLTVNSPTYSSSVSDTSTAVVEISQEQQSVSKTGENK